MFIYIADRKAFAFSAPPAFNSAALPLVRCYSLDFPGWYPVELTGQLSTIDASVSETGLFVMNTSASMESAVAEIIVNMN